MSFVTSGVPSLSEHRPMLLREESDRSLQGESESDRSTSFELGGCRRLSEDLHAGQLDIPYTGASVLFAAPPFSTGRACRPVLSGAWLIGHVCRAPSQQLRVLVL